MKGNAPERLVSGSDDFTMFLWEPTVSKHPKMRMTGHQQPVNHVYFSPDGQWIASASFDKSVKLWNGSSGKFIAAFRGHVGPVYQISWSADSRLLLSGSKDSKKQVGPASAEIKSKEDAASVIDEKKVFVAGVFQQFSVEEFETFISLAEKLRSDYDFGHTLDAKLLPRGEPVDKPTLRLLKPFDELVADSQDFHVDALKSFIEEASIPIVTIFDENKENHPYVNKFFDSPNDKALLFVNFSVDLGAFKPKYNDVAVSYKGKGISFLLGDLKSSSGALDYFGLKQKQAPVIIIQDNDHQKFVKANVEPDQIATWVKEYKEGKVNPFIRSAAIPEVNDEPVKVVVTESLESMVFKSGKNVLLEIYAPWCGHCKKLAPILDEVAVSFEASPDVLIAKLDGTENDVPGKKFQVQGFPTLYFISATGSIIPFEGDRTKDDIIDFIQKNRVKPAQPDSVKSDSVKEEAAKDEL